MKNIIISLTVLTIFLSQNTVSQPQNRTLFQNNLEPSLQAIFEWDTILNVENGVITYTESSKNTFSEIKIDLLNKTIKLTHENSSGFNDEVTTEINFLQKLNLTRLTTADFTVTNLIKNPLIKITGNRFYSKNSCGTAGAIMDLARSMIARGEETNNQDLINYGEALLSLATILLKNCMQQ